MTDAIQKLNDGFRKSFIGGNVLLTRGINALHKDDIAQIVNNVKTFNNFTTDNDPYQEHDFGSFKFNAQKVFWKIDYYDKSLKYGSENPANPQETTRVMTIMLADEY